MHAYQFKEVLNKQKCISSMPEILFCCQKCQLINKYTY